MEEQKNSIFRQQSLSRVSSPEELDQYLQVTGPGVWMTLAVIIVLLIGVFSWMIFGKLDTTVPVAVMAQNGQTVCLIPAEQAETVRGGSVTVGETSYTISDAGYSVQLVSSEMDVNLRLAGQLAEGTLVQPMAVDGTLADGIYAGEIVVETVNPIKFIIN